MKTQDFWSRVKLAGPEECWLFQGKWHEVTACTVFIDGRNKSAARHAWELTIAPLAAGQKLFRTCDSPQCVSPAHHSVQRPKAKRRRTHCKRGHAYVLDEKQCRICQAAMQRMRNDMQRKQRKREKAIADRQKAAAQAQLAEAQEQMRAAMPQ